MKGVLWSHMKSFGLRQTISSALDRVAPAELGSFLSPFSSFPSNEILRSYRQPDMDAFSAGSAVVGVVVAGLHATRILIEDIERIKDVPELLSSTKADLESIEAVLTSLAAALADDGTLPADLRNSVNHAQVEQAVKTCEKRCADFRSTLKKWTRYSTETKTALRDQFRIGMFRDAKIRDFRSQLETCKGTLIMTLSAANLYVFDVELSGAEEAVSAKRSTTAAAS